MDGGSPAMFAGLDVFDILPADEPIENLIGHTGSTAPTSAGSRFQTTPSAGNSPTGHDIPSTSTSPTVVDAPSQPPTVPFALDPSWSFQATPPYDATTAAGPFGPEPSWDLPVSVSQDANQQLVQQFLAGLRTGSNTQHQNGPLHHQHPQYPHPGTNFNAHGLEHPSFARLRPGDTNVPLSSEQHLIRTTLTPDQCELLSLAQQELLKNIAMPPHLHYHSPKSAGSPDSSLSGGHSKGGASSPDAAGLSKSGSRKRKSSAEVDEDDYEEDPDGHHPVKKTAHNMIEKRYRTNLNDKIANLRDAVPALRIMSKSARGEDTTGDREELHGLTPAHKLNKATVGRREPPLPTPA